MVASQLEYSEHGPVRAPGCSQQLYKYAQTRWTGRLFVQMTLYVLFLVLSMGAGGMMPWILQHTLGYLPFHAGATSSSTTNGSSSPAFQHVYREEPGYSYINNNTYGYCKKTSRIGGNLPRGYPAPPLSPKGSQLLDAWHHQPVSLRGIAWPGFNQQPPGLQGLAAGQLAAMEATDLHAIVYELKLLGFNTVKLPFSFQALKAPAANQTVPCKLSSKTAWARRATDPAQHSSVLDTAGLPDPSIYLQPHNGTCNSYLPDTNGLGRLLWTVKYLVANGMYVVLSYKPVPGETVHQDRDVFALAWLSLWTPITCLDNFSADIRGRLMLDLLNEPSRLNGGIGWSSDGAKPGLAKLYLTAMDGIEGVTPKDALYLLQGSAVSYYWATDAGGGLNAYGLSPGDGFVLDDPAVTAYQMSSPKPFLSQLLQRPYSNRVLLAPHLLGPAASGAVLDSPDMLVNKMASSWGVLASEGFCNATDCFRLPVVAGEMGSRLDSEAEHEYYSAVSAYVGLSDTSSPGGSSSNSKSRKHLSGWIWSGYSNVTGPGPILEGDLAQFDWPTLRYLSEHFGLQPWYNNPDAWLNHSSSQHQADADAAAAAAAAAAATAAAKPGGVSQEGNFTGTLEKLYHKAAADTELKGSAVLPALADAAAAAVAASNASVTAGNPVTAVTSSTATVAVAPAPAAAPEPAPAPAVAPPQSPASAVVVAPPTAPSPAPTPVATSPAPAVVTKPATPSESSSSSSSSSSIGSTADVSSSSSGSGGSSSGGGGGSSQASASTAAPAVLGEPQQPSQQAPAAAPVGNSPAPTSQHESGPGPAATFNGVTPAPAAPAPTPAEGRKDTAPADPAAAQQPPAAPTATTTTTSGSSSVSSALPPASAAGPTPTQQQTSAAAPTIPPSQPVEPTRLPQQEVGVPRPTTDRPQVQEPQGPISQQDTKLPLVRPDFLLDAAQHATAHSTEPGSPPAAAPTRAAGAPVTAADGRQQAQTIVAPPLQQQPQVPPPQGRRRDRVYIVGHVPTVVKAAAPVPLPQGPAPAPVPEGIDSFTQMLWDRRLGASGSGSALHQTKVAEGDYGQEAPVLRP